MNYPDGLILEYRFYRLFLARGLFAERSLHPAVGDGYEKSATDIDVLAIDYGTGFHSTRLNVECKSGKNLSKLDRIIWLAGVQTLLKSEISYLVVPDVDSEVTSFGKKLNVFTITPLQLEIWEQELKLDNTKWFARSNYQLFEPAHKTWSDIQKQEKGKDSDWLLFKDVSRFLKYDSWLNLSFGNLNRLLRLGEDIAGSYSNFANNKDKVLCAKYSMGALFVRFCQMLVDICEQLMVVPPSQLNEYLISRLIFGDNDSRNSKNLIDSTLSWVRAGLSLQGTAFPQELNVERLVTPPRYSKEFVALIELLLSRPSETCMLPLTAELITFESEKNRHYWTEELCRVFDGGQHLVLNSKGFFLRAVGATADLLDGIPLGLGEESIKQTPSKVSKTVNSATLSQAQQLKLREAGESNLSEKQTSQESVKADQISATGISATGPGLQLAFLDLGKKGIYLACTDEKGNRLGESILSPEEAHSLKQRLGINSNNGDFTASITVDKQQEIEKLGLQRLSEIERERIAAGWIEWQLTTVTIERNLVLKSIEWKKLGNRNEFITSLNDGRKIVEVSAKQLLDISNSAEARHAFKTRVIETISGIQFKKPTPAHLTFKIENQPVEPLLIQFERNTTMWTFRLQKETSFQPKYIPGTPENLPSVGLSIKCSCGKFDSESKLDVLGITDPDVVFGGLVLRGATMEYGKTPHDHLVELSKCLKHEYDVLLKNKQTKEVRTK